MTEEKTIMVHALIYINIFGLKVRKRYRKVEIKSPRIAAVIADTWAKNAKLNSKEQITVWID